jgi:hypothetical protein
MTGDQATDLIFDLLEAAVNEERFPNRFIQHHKEKIEAMNKIAASMSRQYQLEVALSEASEELRSALEIAQRQGLRTNWAAFESSLRKVLSDIRLELSDTSQDRGTQ